MTIDEAVEIRRSYSADTGAIDNQIAASVLADAYLHLTDPTPLTRELIEKELGKPCEAKSDGVAVAWSGHSLYLGVDGSFCLNYRRIANKTTLGQLRQLVAILRGGRA